MSEVGIDMAMLLGGLLLLVLAGDWLVSGALSAANRYKFSPIIAGTIIVGFGTSLPEMIVTLQAGLQGKPGLAYGNIVGSNIANTLLILGVPAVIFPLVAKGKIVVPATMLALAATLMWVYVTQTLGLYPQIGFVFVACLIGYLFFIGQYGGVDENEVLEAPGAFWVLRVFAGILGLPIASKLMVDGGIGVAEAFNVSDTVIGLTIIALGTSLPELGAALAAAFRRSAAVVIGNVLGSNIFNIVAAGGTLAFVVNEKAPTGFAIFDHWVMLGSMILASIFIIVRGKIDRVIGMILLVIYVAYILGVVYEVYNQPSWPLFPIF